MSFGKTHTGFLTLLNFVSFKFPFAKNKTAQSKNSGSNIHTNCTQSKANGMRSPEAITLLDYNTVAVVGM